MAAKAAVASFAIAADQADRLAVQRAAAHAWDRRNGGKRFSAASGQAVEHRTSSRFHSHQNDPGFAGPGASLAHAKTGRPLSGLSSAALSSHIWTKSPTPTNAVGAA